MMLHGKPSLSEVDTNLLKLHHPMDQIQLAKVMMQDIEKMQMFLITTLTSKES